MTEDEEDELVKQIFAAWDKLPMPPQEWIERFEKSAQSYDAWRKQIDPTGKMGEIEFSNSVVSEEQFNKWSIETRVDFLVNVFKIWHRQPNPN